jgi:K(+)-stimulated pyrophosphate-energized sodium pump
MLPASALASEGDSVSLHLSGTDQALLGVAGLVSLFALLVAFLLARGVLAQSRGSEQMVEVADAIRSGAVAYLKQQVRTMSGFVAVLFLALFGLNFTRGIAPALGISFSFMCGVIGSYIAGSTGMIIAVNANSRTANGALTSYKKALETAFRSGAVAGLLTVGIGLLGATIILLLGGKYAIHDLVGFGFGGSLAALFMRVGGGIFTKAADVGADLVGKVEAGIPEDDPRNPAVIADNVGDNVGDCAGMAADVFESYEVMLVAAIIHAAATSFVVDQTVWMKLVVFAMIVSGIGILSSVIGIFAVRGSDDPDSDPLAAIRRGFVTSAAVCAVLVAVASYFLMGGRTTLTSNRLVSTNVQLRKDAAYFGRIRDEMAKAKPTAAAVAQAQQAVASQFNKKPSDITAVDIYTDPTKVPAPLLNVPQAAVDRFLRKDTSPVAATDVTATDLLNSSELKAKGMGVYDAMAIQQALAPADQLPAPPSMTGYEAVGDVKTSSHKELDYGMLAQSTPSAPANPNEPYTTVRQYFSGTGDNAVVVAQMHVTAHQAETPSRNGAPARAARDFDFTSWQGPQKYSDLKNLVEQAKARATGGSTLKVDFGQVLPVTLFVNPQNGDLAVGIPPQVERPYALAGGQQGITYYKESADALNSTYAAAQKNHTRPNTPSASQIVVAASDPHPIPWWGFTLAVWIGIALAFAIERLTEYYVSTHKKPVQEVAGVSSAGAAPMIIQGFAYGLESSAMMVVVLIVAIMIPLFIFPSTAFGSYALALYGVALVGLGLLSMTGFVLAMDTFGPISDNAQGVFEMSGAGHNNAAAAKLVGHLDAAGNTTKALTKGFAIASAVVAAIALFNSFRGEAMLTDMGLKLDVPEVFLGLLIGGAAPFLFSAFAINAVGRSSFELINEVRRQFREMPGIMLGTTKPDYGRCVEMVTAAAQRELLAPGILAIALPIAVAFGFSIGKPPTTINGVDYNLTGAQALGGFLAGAILSGQLMAILLSNSGGIWDNAKKLIEDGLYGGKGSEAHKGSVVCDTVGDPFKDTAGPALNPLIKVMNLVALLVAAQVIRPLSNPVLITITAICIALLVYSIHLSKKGSFSQALLAAQQEGASADQHFTHNAIEPPASSASAEPPMKKRRITVEDDV